MIILGTCMRFFFTFFFLANEIYVVELVTALDKVSTQRVKEDDDLTSFIH